MSRLGLALLLFLGAPVLARAQALVLLHEYKFNNSLADGNGSGPALQPQGGTVGAGSYTFGQQQGLRLQNSAIDPASYSIELVFSLQNLSSWRKIIDFKSLGPDAGLYSKNGQLEFYNFVISGTTDFAVNTPAHLVLTRDSSTKLVKGFVNGAQVISFTDSGDDAVFPATAKDINFFLDDAATGFGEASAGSVNTIRLYSAPLSAAQVFALYQGASPLAVVPEPSTALLSLTGLGALLLGRRNRQALIGRR